MFIISTSKTYDNRTLIACSDFFQEQLASGIIERPDCDPGEIRITFHSTLYFRKINQLRSALSITLALKHTRNTGCGKSHALFSETMNSHHICASFFMSLWVDDRRNGTCSVVSTITEQSSLSLRESCEKKCCVDHHRTVKCVRENVRCS